MQARPATGSTAAAFSPFSPAVVRRGCLNVVLLPVGVVGPLLVVVVLLVRLLARIGAVTTFPLRAA